MTLDDCKAVVDAHADAIATEHGVGYWKIVVHYKKCKNPNWAASVDVNFPYERATITLDPDHHDSAKEIIDSLRHEMRHIAHGPMYHFYDVATAHLEEGDPKLGAINEAWVLVVEQTNIYIRRAMDGAKVVAGEAKP